MWRALATLSVVLTAGCRQLLSSDSYRFGSDMPGPEVDASVDDQSSPDDSDGDTRGCKLAVPPGRNITGEVGGNVEIVFAMRTIDLGDVTGADGVPGYRKLGYDLDGRCTSSGDPPTCA